MELKSKSIKLRLVEESDADFILKLRLDDRYNQFLSGVSPSLSSQINWIRSYKAEEKEGVQFYFIIERLDGTKCGTIRVYDIRKDSFCWGSWILNEDKTKYAAIESAFLIYNFGFQNLGLNNSHYDVMKGNERVISFHKKMGAKIVSEDSENYYFNISKDAVEASRVQLKDKI